MQPYPEESFGHFLGRFRRANHLSSPHLSALLGQEPYVVSYWESPSRQRQPEPSLLQRLSQLSGVPPFPIEHHAISTGYTALLANATVCRVLCRRALSQADLASSGSVPLPSSPAATFERVSAVWQSLSTA